MLTFIFMVLMILIFAKILVFAIKAAWGITKVIMTVVFLPLVLVLLVLKGLLSLAFPLLVIIGVISLVMLKD